MKPMITFRPFRLNPLPAGWSIALGCLVALFFFSWSARCATPTPTPSQPSLPASRGPWPRPSLDTNQGLVVTKAADPAVRLAGILVEGTNQTAILSWTPSALFRECVLLRPGESRSRRALRVVSIKPDQLRVTIEVNGVATNLALPEASFPRLQATVPDGQFQCALADLPMAECAGLYCRLTDRTVIAPFAVPNRVLTASLPAPVTKLAAAEWLKEQALQNDVAILPVQDYLALVLPASQTNLARFVVPVSSSEGAIRDYAYYFPRVTADVLLDDYAKHLGRQPLVSREVDIALGTQRFLILTGRPLTKPEVVATMETLLRMHSVQSELVGEKEVRFTLVPGSETLVAPGSRPSPGSH
jgi:hypothetical protein